MRKSFLIIIFLAFHFFDVQAQMRERYVPMVDAHSLDSMIQAYAKKWLADSRNGNLIVYAKVQLDEILSFKDTQFVNVRSPFELLFIGRRPGRIMIEYADPFSWFEPQKLTDSLLTDSLIMQSRKFCSGDFLPVWDTVFIKDPENGKMVPISAKKNPQAECLETIYFFEAASFCSRKWFPTLGKVPTNQGLLQYKVLLQARRLFQSTQSLPQKRHRLIKKKIDISLYPSD